MSDAAFAPGGASMPSKNVPTTIPPQTEATGSPPDAPRSFFRQVFRDTFNNARARVGAAWIGILVFLAVFAPFLANTHPVLMRAGGRWTSPLVRNLTQTDVCLLVIFAAAIVLSLV